MGERARCSLNYVCHSLCCCCFSFLWVFYVFVGPLRGTHLQGQQSRQRFWVFFPPPDLLYPVDIVLRILLKQPSTETHHSGEEWAVCSPSSQCEAGPITRHNARFWETLGCFWMRTLIRIVSSGGPRRAADPGGGRWTDKGLRWRFYPSLLGRINADLFIRFFF